jgi:hypothetical protein
MTFDGKEFIKTCHLFPVLAEIEKQQRTLYVTDFCAHLGCDLSEQKLFRRYVVQRSKTHFMLSTLFLEVFEITEEKGETAQDLLLCAYVSKIMKSVHPLYRHF